MLLSSSNPCADIYKQILYEWTGGTSSAATAAAAAVAGAAGVSTGV